MQFPYTYEKLWKRAVEAKKHVIECLGSVIDEQKQQIYNITTKKNQEITTLRIEISKLKKELEIIKQKQV